METENKDQLLEVARSSIRYGLDHSCPISVSLENVPEALRRNGACFITLTISGELRGCIGSLVAHRSLLIDVAENAFSAAFRDPRFPPLNDSEFEKLHVHISVLNPPTSMIVNSEQELLSQIEVGTDGLILSDGDHRATFLPSVWDQLPEKTDFLRHLKIKAGLPSDYWSDSLKVERYTVESFGS